MSGAVSLPIVAGRQAAIVCWLLWSEWKGKLMDLHLAGSVAVVVGGANGIGLSVAETFAGEGASVALWDVDQTVHTQAERVARDRGVSVVGEVVDVNDPTAIDAALAATTSSLGPIDHLVHAAAVGSGRFGFPFTNLDPSDWRPVLEVNVLGLVHVAHAVTPEMVRRQTGSVLFVASVAGQIGSPTDPPYSASKAAGINFAQCMAKDLAPHGVRVNTLCPGMVKTALNQAVWQAWNDRQAAADKQDYEQWARQKIEQMVPLGRWQTPQDMANMVVFLASDRAANVTGQTVNVDGGFVMHW